MSDLEKDYFFNCPYCMEKIFVSVDLSAGRRQSFVQDCEVCCRPIDFQVEVDREGVVLFHVRGDA